MGKEKSEVILNHVAKTTLETVSPLTMQNRFRQNGEGETLVSGVIITPKKGDGFYWAGAIALLVGMFTTFIWAPKFLG